MREERIPDADVGRHCPAKITRQQQRAEDRGPRDDVGERRKRAESRRAEHDVGRVAELRVPSRTGCSREQFAEAVEEQEKRGDSAEHTASPSWRVVGRSTVGTAPANVRGARGTCMCLTSTRESNEGSGDRQMPESAIFAVFNRRHVGLSDRRPRGFRTLWRLGSSPDAGPSPPGGASRTAVKS